MTLLFTYSFKFEVDLQVPITYPLNSKKYTIDFMKKYYIADFNICFGRFRTWSSIFLSSGRIRNLWSNVDNNYHYPTGKMLHFEEYSAPLLEGSNSIPI